MLLELLMTNQCIQKSTSHGFAQLVVPTVCLDLESLAELWYQPTCKLRLDLELSVLSNLKGDLKSVQMTLCEVILIITTRIICLYKSCFATD